MAASRHSPQSKAGGAGHGPQTPGILPQQSINANEYNVRNVAGDYQDHSKTKIQHITVAGKHGSGLDLLLDHVAPGALHDSAERGAEAPKCHPDTRTAVQKEIMSWIKYGEQDDEPKKIIWLSGPAGSGKTAIAGTIADECYEKGLLAASFFFSAFSGSLERRLPSALVPTLVYRLLEHGNIDGLKQEILAALEADPMMFHRHMDQQIEYLVLKPLRKIAGRSDPRSWPIVIIIDGLDECDGHELSALSAGHHRPSKSDAHKEILSALGRACADPAFPFRIVIASRPEPTIRHFFNSHPALAVELFLDDKYEPDADIRLYLEAMLSDIRRRCNLPSSWAPDDVVDLLVQEASGQFIYASTVMRFLNDPRHPPQKQLKRLLEWRDLDNSEPFAPLDALYHRILRTSPEPVLAAKWILFIHRNAGSETPSLSRTSLYVKTVLETYIGETDHVLANLTSLVGLVDDAGHPHFRLYHKSLLDFLGDRNRSRDLHVSNDSFKSFASARYYDTLRGRNTRTNTELVLMDTDPELYTFPTWLSHKLDLNINPHDEYTADDVRWWLEHLDDFEATAAIPQMFAIIHKRCRWYSCLSACRVWRKEILERCRVESWRLPNIWERLRDKFSSVDCGPIDKYPLRRPLY